MALVPWLLPLGPGGPLGGAETSWVAGASPRPALRLSLFSSTSPPRDQVCQGRGGAGAAPLLVCVAGVVCVCFLVFGLMIAALLPRVGSAWAPHARTLFRFPPGPAARHRRWGGWRCWLGAESPTGRACLGGWGVDMWHIEIYIL